MQSQVFRIEKMMDHLNGESDLNPLNMDAKHREIMAMLNDIKMMLSNTADKPAEPSAIPSEQTEDIKSALEVISQFKEIQELKTELNEIHEAIEDTKKEILLLHNKSTDGEKISRASDELSAIVLGTEDATESILDATEVIDQNARNLAALLTQESENNMASDIQDQVMKIFEACNFQDLTGQRISKVIKTFSFVENRVIHMMEIWGGITSFDNINLPDTTDLESNLLNGPALETDTDIADQSDIDALFD